MSISTQLKNTEGFGAGKVSNLGVRSSVATKKVGCSVLKNLIEEDKLIIEDADLISELTTFVSKKQSFEAEEGHNRIVEMVDKISIERERKLKTLLDAKRKNI